ncbi:AraC family transcriptional regulator [Anaerotignum propionicum]
MAFRYGYSSSEAFARAFSQAFQCSPRQYRKASVFSLGSP